MPDDLARMREEYSARDRSGTHRDSYTLSNPAHLFLTHQRQRALLRLLSREGLLPLRGRRILEVGCGTGKVLHDFLGFGARTECLHGIELLEWRVSEAKRTNPALPVVCGDGRCLPYQDASFDIVVQHTMFSSVLAAKARRAIAAEMIRVVKPDGVIISYDFWCNPANPQTVGLRKSEIRRLFPGKTCAFDRITLAPPIARKLVDISWLACYILERIRILNSHYLVAIRRR